MAVVGRILLMPKGTYNASTVYNALDWVRNGGAAWVCTTDNTTGITPSASTPEWQLLAEDGTVGGWNSIQNKPFSTVGAGLDVNVSDELILDAGLGDLKNVSITSPQKGQVLEYDNATQKWKNVKDTFVRYGGSKTYSELMNNHATYLTANYEDMFFSCDGGIIQAADINYWAPSYNVGDVIPADSHIAVIPHPTVTGTYVYDDFGGFVDISGKADRTEIIHWYDKTLPSGQVSYSLSISEAKTTSRLILYADDSNTGVPQKYEGLKCTTNGTVTLTFSKQLTNSLKISLGIANVTGTTIS